jgi:hypothetical protein
MQPGITALILVCAGTLRISDCTIDNATDMMMGMGANTPIECLMNSQALVAQSALAPLLKNGQYLKVVCVKSKRWRPSWSVCTRTRLLLVRPLGTDLSR